MTKRIYIVIATLAIIIAVGWAMMGAGKTGVDNIGEGKTPLLSIENVKIRIDRPTEQLFSLITEPIETKPDSNTEFCFANFNLSQWNDGSYHRDGGSMVLDIFENEVTGTSYFQIAGKDTWFSRFKGTIDNFTMPVTINGWEESSSEGVTNKKEAIKLILDGRKVEVVRPETSDNPTDTILAAVYCEEWREFELVHTHLKTELDFYPDYLVLDYENNTGYALTSYFPDENGDYTQQKKNITYTTDDEHTVLEVKMEGLKPAGSI